MRKLFMFAVAALVMLATSCAKDEVSDVQMGDMDVTFSVALPDATRSIGDGLTADKLYVSVFNEGHTEQLSALNKTAVQMTNGTAQVTLRLVSGKKYDIVFWAQAAGAPYAFDHATGKMTVNNYTSAANDENRDAFYAFVDDYTASNGGSKSVTLTRPFAQLNVATADFEQAKDAGVVVAQTKVKVTGVYSTLNLFTGAVEGNAVDAEFALASFPTEQFSAEHKTWLSMNYLLVNQKVLSTVTMTTDKADVEVKVWDNVPLQRNYRTNILGNILTAENDFSIEVDEAFNPTTLPSEEVDKLMLAAQMGGEYTLSGDVTLTTPLVVGEGVDFTLNLNGYSINIASGNAIKNNGNLTINGTISTRSAASVIASATTYGVNNSGVLVVNGAKVNAIFNSGKMTFNDGIIENTISEKHGIYHSGSELVINNGVFSTTSKNELIRAASKNVTINNGTFTQLAASYLLGAENAGIVINGGTFNGYVNDNGTNDKMRPGAAVVKGGVFNFDVTTWVAEGYVVKDNGNGTWGILPDVEGVDEMVMHAESCLYYNGNDDNFKSVFYIFSAEDMQKAVAYFVNKTSEANIVSFELMEDLDMSNVAWEPWSIMWISFDGKNHTISNLTTTESWIGGLFGYAGAVTIKNLTLRNVTVYGAQAGILAGNADGLKVENVKIEGENSVTYKAYSSAEYTETWGGIGALTGVMTSSNVNAEIAAGATITLDYNNLETQASFVNLITGYLNANSGTIVNNGEVKVKVGNDAQLANVLKAGASNIELAAGEYNLNSGLVFAANNITITGASRENSVVKMDKQIRAEDGVTVLTLKNLTANVPTGLGYTEHTFAWIHYLKEFNMINCNSNGRIRLNSHKATIDGCTFDVTTSSGFDGYAIQYQGATNSNVVVKNSTFNTVGKAIVMYNEGSRVLNLDVEKCTFVSADSTTDKAAIQMHTEYGISGTLDIVECTATGFADVNGGLWNELNNNTKVPTSNFDITVDGVNAR